MKTAYFKCLLISTWNPITMKLKSQLENDEINSENARYDHVIAQKSQILKIQCNKLNVKNRISKRRIQQQNESEIHWINSDQAQRTTLFSETNSETKLQVSKTNQISMLTQLILKSHKLIRVSSNYQLYGAKTWLNSREAISNLL